MKVTDGGNLKHRLLRKEGCPQRVSAEQKEYAEACASPRMTEIDITDTKKQTEELLEEILASENLNRAFKQVKRNKGAGGIDGMLLSTYSYPVGYQVIRHVWAICLDTFGICTIHSGPVIR